MSRTFLPALLAASVVLSAIPGCAISGLLPFGQNTSKPGPAQGEFKSKLANLEFRSISQETQNQLEKVAPNLMGNSGSASAAREAGVTAPAAPNVGADAITKGGSQGGGSDGGYSMGVPTSSYAPSIYNYGYYFSGPFGPMKLDKVVEATTAGSNAGWSQIRDQLINPVLADWATDAGLITSSATLDDNGDPIQAQGAYPGEVGWRLAYAAPSIREAMYFLVTPAETKVVRMRWVPITIDTGAVKVDAKAAIDRAKAGIRDAGFKSLEDLKGFGFFYPKEEGFGAPASKGMPPVMSDVAVAAPSYGGGSSGSAGSSTGTQVYYQPKHQEQELYELQGGGRWYANLSVIGDYTLWELNYNAYANVSRPDMGRAEPAIMPAVPSGTPRPEVDQGQEKPAYKPEPYSYVDNYVYAYVDARNGDVIRLRRPRKVSVTYTETTYPTYGDRKY